jgi:SAM-dependent methyltransferase
MKQEQFPKHRKKWPRGIWAGWALLWGLGLAAPPLRTPDDARFTAEAAARITRNCREVLAPVYGPLAEQIVRDFHLAGREGIGIDLGSGPGHLIFELCARTRMYWINADINPHFFPEFLAEAGRRGWSGRVGAVFADARALPFRDDYADVIVSRGSFQFWGDWQQAFGEVYRVLRPGGVAYIGRGFARDFPVAEARRVRDAQHHRFHYDVAETARRLAAVMQTLGIHDYTIHQPHPPAAAGILYGIWLEIHKPRNTPPKQTTH